MSDTRPIGVFDSGLGGLTVLSELVQALPGENFIYLGDTARVPYGTKSPRVIKRYSRDAAAYLLEKNVKLLIIACNTATAHAETLLREKLSIPVMGVIRPGVEALLAASKNRRVAVLGTRSTIRSGVYENFIRMRNPDFRVFSRACPLFVPLVEEGWVDKKITSLVIREYLSELEREEVDTVVLGCTHYPLLKRAILDEYPKLQIIDSSAETARQALILLKENELLQDRKVDGSVRLHLTDIGDQMEQLVRLFFIGTFQSMEEVRLQDSEDRD